MTNSDPDPFRRARLAAAAEARDAEVTAAQKEARERVRRHVLDEFGDDIINLVSGGDVEIRRPVTRAADRPRSMPDVADGSAPSVSVRYVGIEDGCHVCEVSVEGGRTLRVFTPVPDGATVEWALEQVVIGLEDAVQQLASGVHVAYGGIQEGEYHVDIGVGENKRWMRLPARSRDSIEPVLRRMLLGINRGLILAARGE